MNYDIKLEQGDVNWYELEPIYMQHYAEYKERLDKDGMPISEYNPRLDKYFEAFRGGWLLNYVVRGNGSPIGYSNVYLTNDMHNGDFIAVEDTVYILPEHRNGIGRKLVKFILADLKSKGVKRAGISAVTDLRATKLWRRLGFKPRALQMTYTF